MTTAFIITLLAGLSTGIGSAIALLATRTNTKFLCISLGFSAGVMLYVSFMELVPEALFELIGQWGEKKGNLYMMLAFFSGIALIAGIDFLVPHNANPHEVQGVEEMQKKVKLKRVGGVVALSIAIHNFPEGIATFTAALTSLEIALPIAIAIAIHNIPEGVAGIMIFISLDELLPTAEKFGEHHLAIWGMIAGMICMAVSLYIFI